MFGLIKKIFIELLSCAVKQSEMYESTYYY